MSYEIALQKAWDELVAQQPDKSFSVRFLADTYTIEPQLRKVFSLSCNTPAKDFQAILILHYLVKKLKGLPTISGEWLTFREFSGIEGYFDAFKKRSVEPVLRKYGKNPQGMYSVLERLPGKKINEADAAIMLEAFENVPVLIKLWKADEEFAADANIYFDRSISAVFCTEDIVVLAGFVAASL